MHPGNRAGHLLTVSAVSQSPSATPLASALSSLSGTRYPSFGAARDRWRTPDKSGIPRRAWTDLPVHGALR